MVDVGTKVETLEKPIFPLTLTDIRLADRTALIQHLVKALDEGQKPPLEITKALVSRTVSDINSCYFYEEDYKPPKIPWLASSLSLLQEDNYYTIKPHTSQTFPDGLVDIDDEDALLAATFVSLGRLDSTEKVEATKWLTQFFDKLNTYDNEQFLACVFRFIRESPNRDELFAITIDYLYEHRKDHNYTLWERNTIFESPIDDLAWEISFFNREMFFKYLASQKDDSKIKSLLGIFINRQSFPDALNLIRCLIEDEKTLSETKNKLERMGRMMFGFDPDDTSKPFHTSLQSLYKALEFEKYPPNLAVTDFEVAKLKDIIATLPEGTILDLGCGTGRLANGLAKEGVKNIIGLDSSPENLAKAKAADSTGLVNYQEGDWQKIPLPDSSCTLVIWMGRSMCHVEDHVKFAGVLREIQRTLKDGGILLMDAPNPEHGHYRENRLRHLQFLRNVGIPVDKFGEEKDLLGRIYYVVDSPDGVNFYNRFVPPEKEIKNILKSLGFAVEIIDRQLIASSEGDENIYFKAVMKKPT